MLQIVLSLLGPILAWVLEKRVKSEQGKKDLLEFVEIMNRQGVDLNKYRQDALEQKDRVKEMWDKDDV